MRLSLVLLGRVKKCYGVFLIIEMVNDSPVSGSWALNPRAGGRQKIGLAPDLSLVMSRNHLIGL